MNKKYIFQKLKNCIKNCINSTFINFPDKHYSSELNSP